MRGGSRVVSSPLVAGAIPIRESLVRTENQKKMALFCQHCKERLSLWLAPIECKADMLSLCNPNSCGGEYKHRAPLVPTGFALILQNEDMSSELETWRMFDPAPESDSYLNVDDLLEPSRMIDDFSRLNGCCGISGTDGPTHVCSCNAEIGTLNSDCWTWFAFLRDVQNTYWKYDD